MIEFDASDVTRLAVTIGRQETAAAAGVYAVTKLAAQHVKDGMADQARNHPHFRRMADAVSYDLYPTGLRGIGATIGPDKARTAGALGNIMYFGTSNSAPVEDIGRPLEDERPKIERALLDLGDF